MNEQFAEPAEASTKPLPAFRTIAQEIEDQVLSGRLPMGSALPSETSLAEQFSVSRSTIREAIRLLEQIGIIRRAQGRNRLKITQPRPEDIGARIKTAFLLQRTTFEQLWQVLNAIEPTCAAVAAEKVTPEHIESIEDNLNRTETAQAAGGDLVELDIEFHNLIAQATGNGALQLSRETVGELFYPAFTQVMKRLNAGERLILAHRKIFDAIKAGDASEAKNWMERHIGDFQRGCDLANLDFNASIAGPISEINHEV